MAYSAEIRRQVQDAYETGTDSVKELSRRFGIGYHTLFRWAKDWDRGDPRPALPLTDQDAPLSPEETRRLLAREARHGKSPVQAIKADVSMQRQAQTADDRLTIPVPLTRDDMIRELAELLTACGPEIAESAWQVAWPDLAAPPGQYAEWWEEQKREDEEYRKGMSVEKYPMRRDVWAQAKAGEITWEEARERLKYSGLK